MYRFKTDHHWTIEATFEVFRALVKKLDDDYGANLDPDGFYSDIANYNVRKYQNCFLGSLGRRSGIVFSGFDDFTLIWPKFKTDFRKDYIDTKGRNSREGELIDSLMSLQYMNGANGYDSMVFNVYESGYSWAKITNKMNPNGPKLFMIHDSQAQPLSAFLAPLFSEIHLTWPLADGTKMDIEQYVRDHAGEFDYIIIGTFATNLGAGDFFKFFEDAPEI
jgi:hypothetical protein